MLDLESPGWSQLLHAYGSAADIPALIAGLRSNPSVPGETEPWFSLWSALAHQGDVYPASFAAVPHILDILANAPVGAEAEFFRFVAWVEICRLKNNVLIPYELSPAYSQALARLPTLVIRAADRPWDSEYAAAALAALAAAKGHVAVAEATLELSSEQTAKDFLTWFFDQ